MCKCHHSWCDREAVNCYGEPTYVYHSSVFKCYGECKDGECEGEWVPVYILTCPYHGGF